MKLTSEKRVQHYKPSWPACTNRTESVITNSVFQEFQNLSIDFGCSKWAFGCFLLHLARYFKMFCAIACRYSSVVTFRTPQVRKRVKPRLRFNSPNAPSTCIERFTRSSFPSSLLIRSSEASRYAACSQQITISFGFSGSFALQHAARYGQLRQSSQR